MVVTVPSRSMPYNEVKVILRRCGAGVGDLRYTVSPMV